MDRRETILHKLKRLHQKGIAIRPLFQEALKNTRSSTLSNLIHLIDCKEEYQPIQKKNTGGRPCKMDTKKAEEAWRFMQDPHYSISQICKLFGVSRSTLYRSMKRYIVEENKNPQNTHDSCPNQSIKLANSIYESDVERVICMGCGECGKKKKAKGNNEEINISQVITPCRSCVRTIGRCNVVPLPHGFVWTGDAATVVASPDLSCCITDCLASTTLCGVSFPPIALQEIRLTGIIQYVINVPVMAENLSGLCVGAVTNISLSDSLRVDNVVCHVPADVEFDCPAAICDVGATVVTTPPGQATRGDNTCGNSPFRGVGVNLLFTLPCVCPPDFCPPTP